MKAAEPGCVMLGDRRHFWVAGWKVCKIWHFPHAMISGWHCNLAVVCWQSIASSESNEMFSSLARLFSRLVALKPWRILKYPARVATPAYLMTRSTEYRFWFRSSSPWFIGGKHSISARTYSMMRCVLPMLKKTWCFAGSRKMRQSPATAGHGALRD